MADAYYITGTKAEIFIRNFLNRKEIKIFKTFQASSDMRLYTHSYPNISLQTNHVVFLYFGRIIRLKGLDILIKAFGKANQSNNCCTLLIVGDGDFKDYCRQLVETEKVNNVLFEPPIDDKNYEQKAGLYKMCDVFVLPSTIINHKAEGWGLTVGEAMSLSKPVIVTDAVGCADDLVSDGYNGYIVKHGSEEALAEGLLKISSDKKRLIEMGKKSREIFEERISPIKMADELSNAINYIYNKNENS